MNRVRFQPFVSKDHGWVLRVIADGLCVNFVCLILFVVCFFVLVEAVCLFPFLF